MAELDPSIIQALNDTFKTLNLNISDLNASLNKQSKGAKEEIDLDKKHRDLIDKINKDLAKNQASMGGFFKELATGRKKFKDLQETLNELDQTIDNLDDTTSEVIRKEKEELVNLRESVRAQVAHNNAVKASTTGFLNLSNTIGKGVVGSFTGAAKAAMSGSDALKIATDFMASNVDTANNATQAGAKALTGFGSAAMAAGGRVGVMGAAATVAGSAIGFLSSSVSDLAKAGIGFMLSQTQKLNDGFITMTSAGALYSGGMQDMINTATGAGVTLDQFSKAVSANAENLSKTGLSVGDASRAMAKAMESGGKRTRDMMFALGMTMEEQASAYAETMALMAGPSGKLQASGPEIAKQTAEYAKNLKLISDLTGQDAKTRMEKLRRDNDTLAFNSYLNSLDKDERTKVQAAMALMSEEDQRAFRERKLYNTLVSADLAVQESANAGIAKSRQEMLAASNAQELDVKRVALIYKNNADETLKNSNALGKSMGLAREGIAAEASRGMNASTQWAIKVGNAADKSIKELEEMSKPEDTTGREKTEVTIAKLNQDMATSLQDLASKNLPAFATAINETITSIKGSVEALASIGVKSGTFFGQLGPAIATGIIGGLVPALAPILLSRFGAAGKAAAGSASATTAGKAAIVAGEAAGPINALSTAASGLGKAAGSGGILSGIAHGLATFGTLAPKILIGAPVLGAAIAAIGAGIAGATWIMGKVLPTLSEGLQSFEAIDGAKLKATGEGIFSLGTGLAVFGVGGIAASIGNIAQNLADGVTHLFGGKTPIEKLVDFGNLPINTAGVENNAKALVAFAGAMSAYKGSGITITGAIAESIAGYFTVKTPLEALAEFGKTAIPNVDIIESNSKAVIAFANAMAAYKGAIPGVTEVIAQKIASFFTVKTPIEALKEFSKTRGISVDAVENNANALTIFANALAKYNGALPTVDEAFAGWLTGIFKNPLPIDALRSFSSTKGIDVDVVKTNADALIAFANAMSQYNGAAPSVGDAFASAINRVFKNKLPLKELEDFGKLDINAVAVKQNADALTGFANTLKSFSDVGTGTNAILENMAKDLQNVVDKFNKVKPSTDLAAKGIKDVEDRVKALGLAIKEADSPIGAGQGGASTTGGGMLSNIMSGALGGAAIGGVAGSFVPGIGTLAGAGVGAVTGGVGAAISSMAGPGPGGKATLQSIRDMIASVESGGSYNKLVGGKVVDLSNMTLEQVYSLQDQMRSSGLPSSAVGRYQFIKGTLQAMANKLHLDPKTKFTPEVQDQLADELIKQQGYDSYTKGTMPKEDFLHKLATQWAGLPGSKSGGVYDGFNTNKAGLNWDTAIAKLAKGGITDGPSIAGEAGPEAVVPLPDGRTIPVRMDMAELVEKMDQMIKVLQAQQYTSERILQASM